jgi:hypothetical protein
MPFDVVFYFPKTTSIFLVESAVVGAVVLVV